MPRAALVIVGGVLAVLAGPARSDPSPESRVPSVTAPSLSVPSTASPPSPAPAAPAAASSAAAPKAAPPSAAISTPVQNAPPATTPAAPEEARYSFHRMGEGFVRLDSRTGELAQCGWSQTGWSCKAVPDERAALDSEIARLQRENAALKKSLLSRGIELPSGVIAEAPPARGPVPPANVPDTSRKEPKGPTDADLDRAIAFMKHIWQRLVDLMIDLQRDIQRKS